MKSVQLRTAKAELSKLVDAVERGDRVVITRHGKPAAVLVPVSGDDTVPGPTSDNLVDFLMTMPYPFDLADEDRPKIRDIDL